MYDVLVNELDDRLNSVSDNTHIVYLRYDGMNVKAELCKESRISEIENRFLSEVGM